jgi:hypothetical protein
MPSMKMLLLPCMYFFPFLKGLAIDSAATDETYTTLFSSTNKNLWSNTYLVIILFEILFSRLVFCNKMAEWIWLVFYYIAPCGLVEVYRCFRGACCLSYHGEHCWTFYHFQQCVSYAGMVKPSKGRCLALAQDSALS